MKEEFSERNEYTRSELDFQTLPDDPITLLKNWLTVAEKHMTDANAMVLSTVGQTGQPSSRVVLLRYLDEEGIKFFTNYSSIKGRNLMRNNQVSAHFYWRELQRQVSILGRVTKVSSVLSDSYFASRPRESQIGAWASRQSEVLESREKLDSRVREKTKIFAEQDVPRPDFWGGYNIEIDCAEFWQGRANRLHDRLLYQRLKNSSWAKKRLYP